MKAVVLATGQPEDRLPVAWHQLSQADQDSYLPPVAGIDIYMQERALADCREVGV